MNYELFILDQSASTKLAGQFFNHLQMLVSKMSVRNKQKLHVKIYITG